MLVVLACFSISENLLEYSVYKTWPLRKTTIAANTALRVEYVPECLD